MFISVHQNNFNQTVESMHKVLLGLSPNLDLGSSGGFVWWCKYLAKWTMLQSWWWSPNQSGRSISRSPSRGLEIVQVLNFRFQGSVVLFGLFLLQVFIWLFSESRDFLYKEHKQTWWASSCECTICGFVMTRLGSVMLTPSASQTETLSRASWWSSHSATASVSSVTFCDTAWPRVMTCVWRSVTVAVTCCFSTGCLVWLVRLWAWCWRTSSKALASWRFSWASWQSKINQNVILTSKNIRRFRVKTKHTGNHNASLSLKQCDAQL